MPNQYIKEIKTFQGFLNNGLSLRNCTFQQLDFTGLNINWDILEIHNTTFLGCKLALEDELNLRRRGAYFYHSPDHLPYNPYRSKLYRWQELMAGFDPIEDNSQDLKIYEHFYAQRFNPSINEALWQRIHDHAIDEALRNLLEIDDTGMTSRKCVGIMGGHSTLRTDESYVRTAYTAKLLGEAGYFVVSGGGPGIMEAANLGAYFAGRPEADLNQALRHLQAAPNYKHPEFHTRAMTVISQYPDGQQSLAVPTWFYGHEPSNLFASHIAKYFSNSIREDTLLAISLYGIVYAPGSAGTTQEIFMDATQNHYGTFNYYSPMVFLGKKRYEIDTMLFPVLKQLAWGREYADLLFLTDEPKAVVEFLQAHPPVKKAKK